MVEFRAADVPEFLRKSQGRPLQSTSRIPPPVRAPRCPRSWRYYFLMSTSVPTIESQRGSQRESLPAVHAMAATPACSAAAGLVTVPGKPQGRGRSGCYTGGQGRYIEGPWLPRTSVGFLLRAQLGPQVLPPSESGVCVCWVGSVVSNSLRPHGL